MRRKSRREFIHCVLSTTALGPSAAAFVHAAARTAAAAPGVEPPFFQTRGVVLVPDDLTLSDWPQRAKKAGLTTVGLHHGVSPRLVVQFIQSERGQKFLEQCKMLGLQVEYELHAMRELLPRELFAKNPGFFRMNEKGERTPDANLCVHSRDALAIAAENALALAKVLCPTTNRFFFWGDDGQPWCRCPKCRDWPESDQALALENHLLAALRSTNPNAQLAHLAYSNTLPPPRQTKPQAGIFLAYAPIYRRYDAPYASQTDPASPDRLAMLDANLAVFDRKTAQVLEYWLDVSRFSRWKKPAVKLPWNQSVLEADLDAYGARGLRHVTSFAVFIDAEYVARHGEPSEVLSYGKALGDWQPRRS